MQPRVLQPGIRRPTHRALRNAACDEAALAMAITSCEDVPSTRRTHPLCACRTLVGGESHVVSECSHDPGTHERDDSYGRHLGPAGALTAERWDGSNSTIQGTPRSGGSTRRGHRGPAPSIQAP